MDELAGPGGAKVRVDHAVTVADPAVNAVDDGRSDEFVGLAAFVRGSDRGRRTRRMLPDPVDDGVVAALDTLPAPVPVHRPVATAERRDPGVGVNGRQPRLEIRDEGEPRGRW